MCYEGDTIEGGNRGVLETRTHYRKKHSEGEKQEAPEVWLHICELLGSWARWLPECAHAEQIRSTSPSMMNMQPTWKLARDKF